MAKGEAFSDGIKLGINGFTMTRQPCSSTFKIDYANGYDFVGMNLTRENRTSTVKIFGRRGNILTHRCVLQRNGLS